MPQVHFEHTPSASSTRDFCSHRDAEDSLRAELIHLVEVHGHGANQKNLIPNSQHDTRFDCGGTYEVKTKMKRLLAGMASLQLPAEYNIYFMLAMGALPNVRLPPVPGSHKDQVWMRDRSAAPGNIRKNVEVECATVHST